jgi:hypothetical protein
VKAGAFVDAIEVRMSGMAMIARPNSASLPRISCVLILAAAVMTPRAAEAEIYALVTPPSEYEVGCFGPCACPIVSQPTYGSFELVYTGSDPLYANYDVVRYIASFNSGPGAVAITGSGKFRIGGEFALVQQLTLDLQIWGQPARHFDSGLVPVSVAFPALNVACAVHGFACLDTVIVVNAKPTDVAGIAPFPWGAGLRATWPNPFMARARIAYAVDRPGHVTLTVLDVAGRRVRTLFEGDRPSAGPGAVEWDGTADDGRPASAGIYWVRMRWPGGADGRRIVKLE